MANGGDENTPASCMIDMQPTLVGPNVTLRPLRADDWDALYAIARDPLLWAGHPSSDRWQEPVFRTFFAEALASGGALLAVETGSGAAIGASRFDTRRVAAGDIEIGWTFVARANWGGTANPAMKAMMLGHALAGYARVVFLVGETNLRSQRALEKIGAFPVDDGDTALAAQAIRHVVYAVDRTGFASGPLGRHLP